MNHVNVIAGHHVFLCLSKIKHVLSICVLTKNKKKSQHCQQYGFISKAKMDDCINKLEMSNIHKDFLF